MIYIGVGLSALLGQTDRAMREPQHVDRAQNWLHVFCVYAETNNELPSSGVCLGMINKNDKWTLHLK
jgi:hypothetical protein